MRSRTGLVALVIFVLVVGVACTSGSASRSSSPASPTTAAHHATDTTVAPAAVDASPKELGAQFEQLLGQHALLAMRLTRSAVMNASDFRQVAETSLEANTDALSQLVGTAYDDTQGARFKQLWHGYVTDLSAYANGAASQDTSAKQAARAGLMAYCDDYGAWLATASNGQIRLATPWGTAQTRVRGSSSRSTPTPQATTARHTRSSARPTRARSRPGPPWPRRASPPRPRPPWMRRRSGCGRRLPCCWVSTWS